MKWAHVKEGWRLFKRRQRVKKHGLHRYEGSADDICRQIVEDCWNGMYFQTSTDYGHYCEFYMRDFGWAVDSLLELGHRERVLKSLEYALEKYSDQGLTTTINPDGKCIDVFQYSPDSICYLVKCLKEANAKELIEKYEVFILGEVKRCFDICFDTETELVRSDQSFGSMKDSTHRYCSTYDNAMIAMMSSHLDMLGLANPFADYNIKAAMIKHLWSGEYFYDDIQQFEVVTGENNTYPYWCGVFTDKDMTRSSIKSVQEAGLEDPFPLKYSNKKFGKEMFWRKWVVSDYQTHSVKTHMGGIFIHVVQDLEPEMAKPYVDAYTQWIEKYGTYLENFTKDGVPLDSAFYYSDEGNLWAANYLTLDK